MSKRRQTKNPASAFKRIDPKYTEAELKARHIGQYMDHAIDRTKWNMKLRAYQTEQIFACFDTLRNSIRAFLTDADGCYNDIHSDRLAQLMIDAYLIRRARGEDVYPPKEIVPINAVPECPQSTVQVAEPVKPKEHVELIDPALFKDKKEVSENAKIRWVGKHLMDKDMTAENALSLGAWTMLLHYRATAQRQEKFFDTVLPKLLTKETGDTGGKLADSGKETIELCARLLAACEEEE